MTTVSSTSSRRRQLHLLLVLTLLLQAFLPRMAAAQARHQDDVLAGTLVICTADGFKRVAVDGRDHGDQRPAPGQHTCPCGTLCHGGTQLTCDRLALRIDYPPRARHVLVQQGTGTAPALARPAHRTRAPPLPA